MNEGGVDRPLSIVIGLVVLSLTFVRPSSTWGLVGAVPLLTDLVGWCPLCTPSAASALVRRRPDDGSRGNLRRSARAGRLDCHRTRCWLDTGPLRSISLVDIFRKTENVSSVT